MKRLLIILLLLLLLVSPLNAQMLQGCMSAGAAAACGLASQTENASSTTTTDIDRYSSTDWKATRFQTGATTNCKITTIVLRLSAATATPATSNLRVCLRTDNTTVPNGGAGGIVGNCSATVNANTIGTSEQDVTFTFTSGPQPTATTYYWISVDASAVDSTHYVNWHASTSATTEVMAYSGDGTTWTNLSSTYGGKFTVNYATP